MPLSYERFLESISKVGLLSPAEVAALNSATLPEQRSLDADTLARELVQQGKLTRYQAAAIDQDKADTLVLGNYLILDRLGAGGMGQVYRARHQRMDRTVALKVLSKKALASPDAVGRFLREVKAAARLTHPNIVTAHDADEAGGVHFLVMEYVEGKDLADLVKTQGPLDVKQAVDCIVQAARGFEHAHAEGVIHRDVKPSNLLLDKRGTVKILDMGLARMDNPMASPEEGDGLTTAGSMMGTADFMAPEQAVDTRHADQRADVYGLGCTLYYLLTAKKVYDGDTIMKKLLAHREQPIPSLLLARADTPPALDAVFRKMIAKRPEDRYQTMRDAREALEAVAAGRSSAPLPVGRRLASPTVIAPAPMISAPRPTAKKRKAKSNSNSVARAVGLIVVLLAGGGWLTRGWWLSEPPSESVAEHPTDRPKLGPTVSPPTENKPVATPPSVAAPIAVSPVIPPPAVMPSEVVAPARPGVPAAERAAAEWVLGVGGKVQILLNDKKSTVRDAAELPAEELRVTIIDLRDKRIDENDLGRLNGLTELTDLDLVSTGISNAGLERLPAIASLRQLLLVGNPISGAGLAQLGKFEQLKSLDLSHINLTSQDLAQLPPLPALQRLILSKTQVDDLKPLERFVTLEELDLSDNPISSLTPLEPLVGLTSLKVFNTKITDGELVHLAPLSKLTFLSIANTPVGDAGLMYVERLASLQSVNLTKTLVSADGIARLQQKFPTCKIKATPGNNYVATVPPKEAPAAPAASSPVVDAGRRQAVPDPAAQQKARDTLKDIYGAEVAQAKKAEEKLALVERMIKQAKEAVGDPTATFVLLDEARGLAIDAGDPAVLKRITTDLAASFAVDELELLAEGLEKIAAKPAASLPFKDVAALATAEIAEAIGQEKIEVASRLSKIAVAAARKTKDSQAVKAAVERDKNVVAIKQQWQAVQAAKETLASTPDDAGANLVVGKYLCFVQADWDAGFVCLARGSDPQFKDLAAASLQSPVEASGQVELAERWWVAAERGKGKDKLDLQAGAAYWYAKALPGLIGLSKTRVEKRLAGMNVEPVVISRGPRVSGIKKLPDGYEEHRVVCSTPDCLKYFVLKSAQGDWGVENNELLIRARGTPLTTYGVYFSAIRCVEVRGRIISPPPTSFRFSVGELYVILNWEDKRESHYRFVRARTAVAGDAMKPGVVSTIRVEQVGDAATFSIDGAMVYQTKGSLFGTVSIHTHSRGVIGIEELVIIGIPDYKAPVTGPTATFLQ